MAGEFQFDVFLSHSAKDKAVVRDVAACLQQSGFFIFHEPVSYAKLACIH